ncbi:inositol-tetrakis phosphate kinase [Acrasis kona]|uniref:Inositol-tetrakisphosphate 1-kinase n=1 Tax=Acrasis kona TaxID=1008807 RepID=A0AAW2ZM68_9EUKA
MRIGYICSRKKKPEMFVPFAKHAETKGIEVVDLIEQGLDKADSVDILFMKITDEMNSVEGKHLVSQVQEYIAKNPNTLVVEKIENVERLTSRVDMYSFLGQKLQNSTSVGVPGITIVNQASTVEQLESDLKRDGVEFPVVVKTTAACGALETHEMAIVFNVPNLFDVLTDKSKFKIPLPVVVQQYINHDATLYKVYVIGNDTFVQARESIRNFRLEETETITFNSQAKLPDTLITQKNSDLHDSVTFKTITPLLSLEKEKREMFDNASKLICDSLDIYLLGYDLVTDSKTGKSFVVDVNYLPGFKGVDNLPEKLLAHMLERYEKRK